MVLTLIILFLIIINLYTGYRDGLVYEFIRIISYIVGWIIALQFTHPLGAFINQFLNFNPILINGLSFLVILVASVLILKAIGRVINRITRLPIIHQLNAIGGAIAGAIVGFLIVLILLDVGLALPSQWLHNEYINSPVAMKIVNQTPGITDHLINK